ncbi:hypothetical protein BU25DRAFT_259908 [Macroventuria anomochaeta]|uniref:Uncharacterized protein n=1 Tax=Macroventuria anomochaeta TaxID=301207 RepID=A0ACB6S917_9PLEO|nr:uncharacterized protein BU25DRAFT_259908 [Macroventuria anomochaeta]KAF2629843.1 hypothetical protein BU25DRAFT_259908 [Macroventuria anomochaeta]
MVLKPSSLANPGDTTKRKYAAIHECLQIDYFPASFACDSLDDSIEDAAKGTIAYLRRLILFLLPDSILARNNVEGTSGVYNERALESDLVRYGQAHGPSSEEVRKLLLGLMRQLNSSCKLAALYPNCRYTYLCHGLRDAARESRYQHLPEQWDSVTV